jgi:multidrug efflux system membrane fusion protein
VVRADDTVTVRQVKVKQQNDQEAAVEEGLSSGEIVVTSGFGRLREGEHVVVDRPSPVDPSKGGKGRGKRVSKSSE